jgi:pyruvyltransferase
MPDLPQATTLKAYWWRDAPNFGDILTPVLLKRLLGVKPEWCDKSPRLLAVGSILVRAKQGDTVWGSGCNPRKEGPWNAAGVRFLAVRGPLTRDFVLSRGGQCPEIYGDPALLLPTIHPVAPSPTRELAIMPHLDDDAGWNFGRSRGIFTINPSWPWERIVAEICASSHVVSSSLHGVIVAEAYGVPATWADFVTRNGKFEDYYRSTARPPPKPLPWPQAIEQHPPAQQQSAPPDLLPALQAWFDTIYTAA